MRHKAKLILFFFIAIIFGLSVLFLRNYYEKESSIQKSDWNKSYLGGDASNFYDRAISIYNFEPYHAGYEDNRKAAYYRPPVYPAFMAGSFLLFGKSLKPVILFQIILLSLSIICIMQITKYIFSEKISILTGILSILYYPFWNGAMTINSELISMSFWAFSVLLLISYLKNSGKKKYYIILSGLLSGVAVMTRGQFMFFAPLILLFVYFSDSADKSKTAFSWFACFIIPIILWTLYAYVTSGVFVIVSTQGAFSTWWGWSKAVVIEQGYPVWNSGWDSIQTPVDQIGEYMLTKDNSWFLNEVVKFVAAYPAECLKIGFYKILGAWGIEFFSKDNTFSYFIVRFFKINWDLILAVPAFFIILKQPEFRDMKYFLISAAVIYTLISFLTAALYRYRYPFIDPFLLMLSGYFLHYIFGKYKSGRIKISN
ncbi:MAG: glycosyltransferase family 39 protein [Ignavibacteria bacterium]|nr:glycosyltransferase family 39 protein [Ignavibacteria bacterium]